MKKASAKSKGKASKPAKKKHPRKSKKPIDLVEVRKDIANIVCSEATDLAQAVVGEGLKGQLAPVKYLFEMTGLYPAAGESHQKPEEASLAKTLLHRLGVPDIPLVKPDDEAPLKENLPAGKCGEQKVREADPGMPGLQPENQSNHAGDKADEDNSVPVLAQSIP